MPASSTRGQLNDEEDVEARQAGPGENLDCEEIAGRDSIPVRAQESLPRDPLGALGCWFDSVLFEDGLYGVTSHFVPEIPECITNSRISPAWVLLSHRDHELSKFCRFARPAWPSSLAAIVFHRDELAVPAEDCVRRDDAAQLAQYLHAELLTLHGEATPLVIGKPKTFGAELLTQHPVLFLQVFDDLLLLPIEPTGERNQYDMPGRHDAMVAFVESARPECGT